MPTKYPNTNSCRLTAPPPPIGTHIGTHADWLPPPSLSIFMIGSIKSWIRHRFVLQPYYSSSVLANTETCFVLFYLTALSKTKGFHSWPSFQEIKVALNPLLRMFFFFKLAESLIVTCWLFSNNKDGVTDFVFELWGAKAKIQGEFHWISCCHGDRLRQSITKTYLAIICLSNDTILLSLSDTEWFYNAIKRQGLLFCLFMWFVYVVKQIIKLIN